MTNALALVICCKVGGEHYVKQGYQGVKCWWRNWGSQGSAQHVGVGLGRVRLLGLWHAVVGLGNATNAVGVVGSQAGWQNCGLCALRGR